VLAQQEVRCYLSELLIGDQHEVTVHARVGIVSVAYAAIRVACTRCLELSGCTPADFRQAVQSGPVNGLQPPRHLIVKLKLSVNDLLFDVVANAANQKVGISQPTSLARKVIQGIAG